MDYKEIFSYSFGASPVVTQILQSSLCRQHMLQVCVVVPHLPSSPAEPSSPPESWLQREDPLFLPALAPGSTLPHLPSCPLCSLCSPISCHSGAQEVWSRFWWGREQSDHSNPTDVAGVTTGLCCKHWGSWEQQWLMRHRLHALLSSPALSLLKVS